MILAAALLTAQALQPAPRHIRAPHRIVQSASATDATERESYLQYNAHAWRGVCRSVVVDATRRRVDYDADLDGKRYSAAVKRRKNGDLEERFSWDDADSIETTLPSTDVVCDFDGSYSCDRASSLVAGTAPSFTIETGLAVSDEARIRVVAMYDGATGLLKRIACLDEQRVGATESTGGAALAAEVDDVFAVSGEWAGDATVRRPDNSACRVLKQDFILRCDGERFYRGLEMRMPGDLFSTDAKTERTLLESYGEVSEPGAAYDSVIFREDGAVLCILPGCYALCPFSLDDEKAFFVEAGCFVDEDDRQGQLPISVRKGIMMEGDPGTSSRFLARSVRLYAPKRELKSVTTSYHQLVDGD